MADPSCRVGLLHHARCDLDLLSPGEAREQDFDGNGLAETQILAEEDRTHAPLLEVADEPVAIVQDVVDLVHRKLGA